MMNKKDLVCHILESQESAMFPYVEGFADYHMIEWEVKKLKERYNTSGIVIMGKEVAYDRDYWGLFWIKGLKPSQKQVEELLRELDFDFHFEAAEIHHG